MPGSKIFLAAALAAASTVAQADASFAFAINGSGDYAADTLYGCSPEHPEGCDHQIAWTGTLTIVTTSDADGVYDVGHLGADTWVPGGIVRVSMTSNAGSTDVDAQAPPGDQYYPDQDAYAVTIAGGKVTSVEWFSTDGWDPGEADGWLTIAGMSIQFLDARYHGAYADMSGTLTAMPVPEPASAALALLGLAAVAAGRRRQRLSPAPGSSPAASAPSGS
jgi:MYXO-CTERM domain-containing protein